MITGSVPPRGQVRGRSMARRAAPTASLLASGILKISYDIAPVLPGGMTFARELVIPADKAAGRMREDAD
jgi:hypothetical protein